VRRHGRLFQNVVKLAFGSGPLGIVIQDLLSTWIYLVVTSVVM
jgi:hypothetical protein